MNLLAEASCESCNKQVSKLTDDEINSLLPLTEKWQLIEEDNIKKIQRIYFIADYKKALEYASAVARLAQCENHHPSILLEYSKVTVTFWTHVILGLHKNDFIMAAKADSIFENSSIS